MMLLEQSACANVESASSREWIETNGLGGFASSTICGLNTRRYHGLLIAALHPPVGRALLLSKLEETLIISNDRFDLSSNQYPGAVHPSGYSFLSEFRLDPFPIFTYVVRDLTLEKRVFMVQGENTVVVQYELKGGKASAEIWLELRPLIAFRDYHSTTHENDAINRNYEELKGIVKLDPYQGMPALFLAHNAVTIAPQGNWYKRFEFHRERERGLDWEEDLFNHCALTFDLARSPVATVIASTEMRSAADAAALEGKERSRRKAVAATAPLDDEFTRALTLAADQFIVKRGEQHTVIAGYPWFGDWGRDTMISLPGLTLLTSRTEIARSVLLEFSKHVSQGMLPNRFPDSGETPEYNNVDGTLWYFEAIHAYHAQTGDDEFVRQLFPLLSEIIDWHVRGTRYRIFVEEATGLLHAGEPGVQLTWMDAKVGDWVVTPRIGKPVEIQALWYNALRIMEAFATKQGDTVNVKRFSQMAVLAQKNFNQIFWNTKENCLYDVVDDAPDASIRPNQIFAVSLPHSMLSMDRAKAVTEKVERELLTPVGLRTLAASDPKYIGRYGGDQRSRDAAYHQGTVWPWLLGPFVRAYLKVNANSAAARAQAKKWLQPFAERLSEAGLGTIPEIFDGDPPHRPCGCIAQAWSVAEILRAWVEAAQPEVESAGLSARGASRK